jgi:two-component system heavy metal sensor histidine kinase CusS
LATFIPVVASTGILHWGLISLLTRSEDLFLTDKVHVLRAILRDRPDDINRLRWETVGEVELSSGARRYEQFYVRLVDESGNASLSSKVMDSLLPAQLFAPIIPADVEPSHGTEIHLQQGRSFRIFAARARVGNSGDKTMVIQVALDRANDALLLANYRLWMGVVVLVATVICPLAGYRIAQRGIDPVREITETARKTGSSTLDARIDSDGYPVELAALADTLNAMLDRLADSFHRLSQFSADIAHELRTPINNMRGEAEVTLSRARSIDEYKEALTSCLEESVRLSDLIARLLFLARAENPGTHLDREYVHIGQELAAVREYYAGSASEAGVTLNLGVIDDIVVALDRRLVRQAIGNLVANSIAHTPPGGTIILTAAAEDGHVCIDVHDTGSGIPAADLPRVFDRFYRADRSRSSQTGGMGLGLAIVKGVVTLHGGQTEISSEECKGTKVRLRFPIERARPGPVFGEIRTSIQDDENVISTL